MIIGWTTAALFSSKHRRATRQAASVAPSTSQAHQLGMRVEQAVQQPPLHAAPAPQSASWMQVVAWQPSSGLERARMRATYSSLSRKPTHYSTSCCVHKRPRACAAAHLTATARSSSNRTIRRSAPPMLGRMPS